VWCGHPKSCQQKMHKEKRERERERERERRGTWDGPCSSEFQAFAWLDGPCFLTINYSFLFIFLFPSQATLLSELCVSQREREREREDSWSDLLGTVGRRIHWFDLWRRGVGE